MLKTYLYKCKNEKCNYQWTDARPEQYAEVPAKLPCCKCGGRDIEYGRPPPQKKNTKQSGPSICDPVRMGVIKPDDGFKEVLQKIKSKYPGSTINTD